MGELFVISSIIIDKFKHIQSVVLVTKCDEKSILKQRLKVGNSGYQKDEKCNYRLLFLLSIADREIKNLMG